MDVPFEWEENRTIDPKVYEQAAKDGLLVPLAYGAHIPERFANKDGTVFGGIPVKEWDGCASLPRAPRDTSAGS